LNRDPDVTSTQIEKDFGLHITMCCYRTITTEDILPNNVQEAFNKLHDDKRRPR